MGDVASLGRLPRMVYPETCQEIERPHLFGPTAPVFDCGMSPIDVQLPPSLPFTWTRRLPIDKYTTSRGRGDTPTKGSQGNPSCNPRDKTRPGYRYRYSGLVCRSRSHRISTRPPPSQTHTHTKKIITTTA